MRDSDRLFDRDFTARIAKDTGLNASTLANLMDRLEEIGIYFRNLIENAPTKFARGPKEMTRLERLEHLQDVRATATRLSAISASPEKLSPLPDRITDEMTGDDWIELQRLIDKMLNHTNQLEGCIEDRWSDGSSADAEFRIDLVFQVSNALREFGIYLARNNYSGIGDAGLAASIISDVCGVICGAEFPIDDQLRQYIKYRRGRK